MVQTTCPKCVELWREYGRATREHLQRLTEQEQYSKSDLGRFHALNPLVEVAAEDRDEARLAIKIHLAKEHPNEAMRTAGGIAP